MAIPILGNNNELQLFQRINVELQLVRCIVEYRGILCNDSNYKPQSLCNLKNLVQNQFVI